MFSAGVEGVYRLSSRSVFDGLRVVFALTLLIALSVTGIKVGLTQYSPDSWSYYELSKTIFSGELYRFNTFRSYFSETYSASFPLGYPVLIALGHLLLGEDPRIAVAINIVAAFATWLLITRLANQFGFRPLAGIVVATSLVLWPHYLDEVFAGRSIPIASLALLAALSLYVSRQWFAGGVLLGFSALLRFDFLVFGILLLVIIYLVDHRNRRWQWRSAAGFLFGVLPWVIYSLAHFGRWWVSDNSWVALSVESAYVLDYPAVAAASIFDNPHSWLVKIASHLPPMVRLLAESALGFPLVLVSAALAALAVKQLDHALRRKALWIVFVSSAALAPYLMTGYLEGRYLALLMVAWSGLFIYLAQSVLVTAGKASVFNLGLLLALLASVWSGGVYMANVGDPGLDRARDASHEVTDAEIERLRACQLKTPTTTLIFGGEIGNLAPRYGALTGLRTAIIPSNFGRMSDSERHAYFANMGPYRLLENKIEMTQCGP